MHLAHLDGDTDSTDQRLLDAVEADHSRAGLHEKDLNHVGVAMRDSGLAGLKACPGKVGQVRQLPFSQHDLFENLRIVRDALVGNLAERGVFHDFCGGGLCHATDGVLKPIVNQMPRLFRSGCQQWLLAAVFALAGWSMPSPAAEPQRSSILILGDSLAAGYGLDPSEAFPALIQKKVDAARLNFLVVNAGVSGDTTAGGLRRMDWLLKRRIDVLLLELGGNDGLRGLSVEATRTNLQSIIDRARKANSAVKVVIAGMQMPPNMGEDYNQRFQQVFSDLATTNNTALIPFLLKNVGGNPELNQPDRIHPTAEGHKILAETVWQILEPVLKK